MATKKTQETAPGAQKQPKTASKKTASKKTPSKTTNRKTATRKTLERPLPDNLWEQWPEENSDHYARFCMYRDMAYENHPEEDIKRGYVYAYKLERRSMRAVAEKLGLANQSSIEKLSVKFCWRRRCEEYDAYLRDRVREAHESGMLKMAEDHALLGATMVRKAISAITKIQPDSITAAEAARLAEVGVKIERLSRGQSTENQSINGKVECEGSVKVEVEPTQDLKQLSDDELEQLQALLEKAQVKPDA